MVNGKYLQFMLHKDLSEVKSIHISNYICCKNQIWIKDCEWFFSTFVFWSMDKL